jgi:hypothetical protein
VLLLRARVSNAEREATVREGARTFIARFGAPTTAERTPPKTRSVR